MFRQRQRRRKSYALLAPSHHLRQGKEMLSSESISDLFIAPRPESAWPTDLHRSDEIFTVTLWPSHRRPSHCTTIMVISWRHRNNCRTIWINVISHTGQMCRFSLIVEFSGVWAVPLKYMLYIVELSGLWVISHHKWAQAEHSRESTKATGCLSDAFPVSEACSL